MSVDSVRRVPESPGLDRDGEPLLYDGFKFTVTQIEHRDLLVDTEEYPFDTPTIIQGDYNYESEPLFGSATTSTGTFQFRVHSKYAVVESEDDVPSAKKVFKALSRAFIENSDSSKEPRESKDLVLSLTPTTKSISNFINRSDQFIGAKVLNSRGNSVDVNSADDPRLETHPIERIELTFTSPQGHTGKVTYSDDELWLQKEGGSDELREYVLQHFEAAFSE